MSHYPLWLPYTDMTQFERAPLTLVRAEGAFVYDTDGRRYTDLSAGTRNVLLGYSRAEIVDAVTEAMRCLPYVRSGSFGSAPALDLARRLALLAPIENARVMFQNSGSEAVEVAFKLLRQYRSLHGDPRTTVLALKLGYHGQTLATLWASGEEYSREPFTPAVPGFLSLDFPTSASDAEALAQLVSRHPDVGAVIVEPVLGHAGSRVLPPGYLAALRRTCDELDLVLVCDEITSGLGRCGQWFMSQDAKPDILLVGKVLTNGYLPLSAALASERIWRAFDARGLFRHGQTYTNHPVCCACGLATLDLLEREDAPALARRLGESTRARLGPLLREGSVTAVRGVGALFSIEFDPVIHRRRGSPKWLQGLLLADGFVVGQIDSTLFLSPPLVLEADEIDRFAEQLSFHLQRSS